MNSDCPLLSIFQGPKSEKMILLSSNSTDPAVNLGLEDELFHLIESRRLLGAIRFWVNRECLIKGRCRSDKYGWYNEKLAMEIGVPVYSRSTGGGVVYQDLGNLNWSFYIPLPGLFVSPAQSFKTISNFLVKALRRLKLDAYYSAPNRIEVEKRKVSGMAARSSVNSMLIHGTFLLNSNLERLNMLCRPPPESPPVSNLSEWKSDITAEEVSGSMLTIFRESGVKILKSHANPTNFIPPQSNVPNA